MAIGWTCPSQKTSHSSGVKEDGPQILATHRTGFYVWMSPPSASDGYKRWARVKGLHPIRIFYIRILPVPFVSNMQPDQEIRPLFNRRYTPDLTSRPYREQLNIMCSRIRISNTRFLTELTDHIDNAGNRLWRAIPIFPRIDLQPMQLSDKYIGRGRSYLAAQNDSLQKFPHAGYDMSLVRWQFSTQGNYHEAVPYLYMSECRLQDEAVFGWGVRRSEAEENAARALLLSENYCRTW